MENRRLSKQLFEQNEKVKTMEKEIDNLHLLIFKIMIMCFYLNFNERLLENKWINARRYPFVCITVPKIGLLHGEYEKPQLSTKPTEEIVSLVGFCFFHQNIGRNRPLSGALKNQRFTNAVPMGYNEAGYWNPPRYNRSTGLPRKKRKITWIRKENGNA